MDATSDYWSKVHERISSASDEELERLLEYFTEKLEEAEKELARRKGAQA